MVFVTGGTGLIGAHLLYELVRSGRKVKALKRKTSQLHQVLKIFSYYDNQAEELFNRIEWAEGDMLDYYNLESLLEGVDEIYHCAAVISFRSTDRQQMIHNNVEGTAQMVNAALENKVKKFCYVSSVAALGTAQSGYLTNEETNWVPTKKVSGYSESKFFSEMEIWRGIEEGLNAIIVNPSIVLGPGNWNSGSPRLFKTVWEGMKFYTRGVTGYVDVKDVVRAMTRLMDDTHFEDCKNQRFLLNAENLSYQEVFSRISTALEKPEPKIYASPLMLGIAWRAANFQSWLTGRQPALTRETAASSNRVKKFDGNKITRFVNFNYLPVNESIKQTASFLKQEMH